MLRKSNDKEFENLCKFKFGLHTLVLKFIVNEYSVGKLSITDSPLILRLNFPEISHISNEVAKQKSRTPQKVELSHGLLGYRKFV